MSKGEKNVLILLMSMFCMLSLSHRIHEIGIPASRYVKFLPKNGSFESEFRQ